MLDAVKDLHHHANNNDWNNLGLERMVKPEPIANPLQSVKAFVDTRSDDGVDTSAYIAQKIRRLGGSTGHKLKDCTHLIWKDGSKAILQRARKARIHIVSTLWVADCGLASYHLPEKKYFVEDLDEYADDNTKRRKPLFPKKLEFSSLQAKYDTDYSPEECQRILARMQEEDRQQSKKKDISSEKRSRIRTDPSETPANLARGDWSSVSQSRKRYKSSPLVSVDDFRVPRSAPNLDKRRKLHAYIEDKNGTATPYDHDNTIKKGQIASAPSTSRRLDGTSPLLKRLDPSAPRTTEITSPTLIEKFMEIAASENADEQLDPNGDGTTDEENEAIQKVSKPPKVSIGRSPAVPYGVEIIDLDEINVSPSSTEGDFSRGKPNYLLSSPLRIATPKKSPLPRMLPSSAFSEENALANEQKSPRRTPKGSPRDQNKGRIAKAKVR